MPDKNKYIELLEKELERIIQRKRQLFLEHDYDTVSQVVNIEKTLRKELEQAIQRELIVLKNKLLQVFLDRNFDDAFFLCKSNKACGSD